MQVLTGQVVRMRVFWVVYLPLPRYDWATSNTRIFEQTPSYHAFNQFCWISVALWRWLNKGWNTLRLVSMVLLAFVCFDERCPERVYIENGTNNVTEIDLDDSKSGSNYPVAAAAILLWTGTLQVTNWPILQTGSVLPTTPAKWDWCMCISWWWNRIQINISQLQPRFSPSWKVKSNESIYSVVGFVQYSADYFWFGWQPQLFTMSRPLSALIFTVSKHQDTKLYAVESSMTLLQFLLLAR